MTTNASQDVMMTEWLRNVDLTKEPWEFMVEFARDTGTPIPNIEDDDEDDEA